MNVYGYDIEPIPKPILTSKIIRVSELLSGSETRLINSKPRSKEAIIEFLDPLIHNSQTK